MKIFTRYITILLLAFIAISNASIAQPPKEAFKKQISLPLAELRMDTLIKYLSKQTGIEFSFNSNKISPSRKITLPSKQPTLEQVLDYLQQKIGIQHKLVGNHIILIDNPKPVTTVVVSKPRNEKKNLPRKADANKPPAVINNPVKKDSSADEIKTVAYNIQSPAKDTVGSVKNNTAKDTLASVKIDTAQPVKKNFDKPNPVRVQSSPAITKENNSSTDSHLPLFLETRLREFGLSIEPRLGRNSTIVVSAGIGGGYFITGKQFSYVASLRGTAAYVSINPRFYFKGRNAVDMTNKEGSYFGLKLKYTTGAFFKEKDTIAPDKWASFRGVIRPALLFNVHLGIQKSLSNRWLINAHAGPGYSFNLDYTLNHWYPSFDFRLGYRLRK